MFDRTKKKMENGLHFFALSVSAIGAALLDGKFQIEKP